MKKITAMIAGLALCQVLTAQTTLTVSDAKIFPGSTGELTVSLDNFYPIGGWQMTLELPTGIQMVATESTLELDGTSTGVTGFESVLSSRHSNHQLVGDAKTYSVLLICLPTAKEQDISGSNGELVRLRLKADASYTGTSEIKIKDFVASDPQGSANGQYTAADISAKVEALTEDPAGIRSITLDDPNKTVYGVSGQRRDGTVLRPGLYIIDGKKMVVK